MDEFAGGLLGWGSVLSFDRLADLAMERLDRVGRRRSSSVSTASQNLAPSPPVGCVNSVPHRSGRFFVPLMREIKRVFDPHGIMNHGKVFTDERSADAG
ncbi:MAG: FAD-linked oxidase C-terminal domain-containing protein [Gaiellaceae bacterium]